MLMETTRNSHRISIILIVFLHNPHSMLRGFKQSSQRIPTWFYWYSTMIRKVIPQDAPKNSSCLSHNSHRISSELTSDPDDLHKTFTRIPGFPIFFQTRRLSFPQYFHNIHTVFQHNSHRSPKVLPLKKQDSHGNSRIHILWFPCCHPHWSTRIHSGIPKSTLQIQHLCRNPNIHTKSKDTQSSLASQCPHLNPRIRTRNSGFNSHDLHWNPTIHTEIRGSLLVSQVKINDPCSDPRIHTEIPRFTQEFHAPH